MSDAQPQPDPFVNEPQWMPPEFSGRPFRLREAEEIGIGSSRRHGKQLLRPYRGVRSTAPAANPLERARDYLPRLKPQQFFAGVTAIRLFGLPWTRPWHPSELVELCVPTGRYAPNSRGVLGHRLAPHRLQTTLMHDMPVLDPIAAVIDVAEQCSSEHLVALCDALLTRSDRYPGLAFRPMCASVDELLSRISEWGSDAKASRARKAAALARAGVDSPPESTTRVVFERAGLPPVQIQQPVETDIGVLTIDGGWDRFRAGYEYEGEHHLTDRQQWHSDMPRFEALARAGWKVTRVTANDLRPANRPALLRRMRSNLAANGWRPTPSRAGKVSMVTMPIETFPNWEG